MDPRSLDISDYPRLPPQGIRKSGKPILPDQSRGPEQAETLKSCSLILLGTSQAFKTVLLFNLVIFGYLGVFCARLSNRILATPICFHNGPTQASFVLVQHILTI